jgi:hypothetical protein
VGPPGSRPGLAVQRSGLRRHLAGMTELVDDNLIPTPPTARILLASAHTGSSAEGVPSCEGRAGISEVGATHAGLRPTMPAARFSLTNGRVTDAVRRVPITGMAVLRGSERRP